MKIIHLTPEQKHFAKEWILSQKSTFRTGDVVRIIENEFGIYHRYAYMMKAIHADIINPLGDDGVIRMICKGKFEVVRKG